MKMHESDSGYVPSEEDTTDSDEDGRFTTDELMGMLKVNKSVNTNLEEMTCAIVGENGKLEDLPNPGNGASDSQGISGDKPGIAEVIDLPLVLNTDHSWVIITTSTTDEPVTDGNVSRSTLDPTNDASPSLGPQGVQPALPRTRNCVANPSEWARNANKQLRMTGQPYTGFRRVHKKSTKKIKQDVPREGRKMGPTCVSKLCEKWQNRLCNTIKEEERQQLFDTFWKNMTWDSKKMFVCASVQIKPTARTRGGENSRRRLSYFYFPRINGEQVPVCQAMYLNTLGIKKSELRYWLEHFHETSIPNASKYQPEKKKVSNDVRDGDEGSGEGTSRRSSLEERRVELSKFFDGLPMVPSHYRRKNSKKNYLQGDIRSWRQLYEMYVDKCNENQTVPLSRSLFDITRKKKNLGIFMPKNDRCDTCTSYEHGHVSAEVYEIHRQKKEEARNEKNKDKEAAENGICHTLCMDLMKVQTAPYIKASSAYFKLKMTVHNFTVYNMANHDSTNYWFDESHTNLCSSTFASCIVDYLVELLNSSPKDMVILFSDGCTYQNRNSVLANALLHLSMERNVTIIQKFLEKGHTQMECDSVHSTVERQWENVDVYTPRDYVTMSKLARKHPYPYRAALLDFTFFKDFAHNQVYASIRPGRNVGDPTVVDLREIRYHPEGKITYKLNFSDEPRDLPVRPKPATPGFNFPQLHKERPKIPKDKWTDLQSLKPLLPVDTHLYYDSVPYEDHSRRKMNRQAEKSTDCDSSRNSKKKK